MMDSLLWMRRTRLKAALVDGIVRCRGGGSGGGGGECDRGLLRRIIMGGTKRMVCFATLTINLIGVGSFRILFWRMVCLPKLTNN